MQHISELADAANSPVGKVLSAAQVAMVKAFLADPGLSWEKQSMELPNEVFRLTLWWRVPHASNRAGVIDFNAFATIRGRARSPSGS
jgi:hypothetical protein